MLAGDALPSVLPKRDVLDRIPLQRHARRHLHCLPDGRVLADWSGCLLSSVFQPIVRAGDECIVAREAYLRCLDGEAPESSPWPRFSALADDQHLLVLDGLCRTLHPLNALAAGGDLLLFVKVHGRLLITLETDQGQAFRTLVEALGFPPERIVIEMPREACVHPDLLAFVLRNYRANGFQVAVNVESLSQWKKVSSVAWSHFVKVDGRTFAGRGATAGEIIKRLEPLREEATVVITRLETPFSSTDVGGIWLQGNAYGRPAAILTE